MLNIRRIFLLFCLPIVAGFAVAALVIYEFPISLALLKESAMAERVGDYYFNGGAYDLRKTERAFTRAAELEPTRAWIQYRLGRVYFLQGELEAALTAVNKELEYHPDNIRAFYLRGLIYTELKKYPLAGKDFARFVEWAPDEWAGHNDLSWVLSLDGKYQEAALAAKRGIKEANDGDRNTWLFNSLGVAYLNLGEYTEAKEAFVKAETLAQKLTVKDWMRAYSGNDPEKAEEGIQVFQTAIKQNLGRVAILEDLFQK